MRVFTVRHEWGGVATGIFKLEAIEGNPESIFPKVGDKLNSAELITIVANGNEVRILPSVYKPKPN